MNVAQVLIPTKVAKAGMSVREVFKECSEANTPGLPFCDDNGLITGRITVKNILKRSCLPEYLVVMAKVLGEQISNVQDMEAVAKRLLNDRAELYFQAPHISLTSASSAIKALAMMEHNDTSYIFVVDEGQYKGVVTIHCLADKLAHYVHPSEDS